MHILSHTSQDGRKLWDPRKDVCVRELEPPSEAWAKSDPDLVALLAKETTETGVLGCVLNTYLTYERDTVGV